MGNPARELWERGLAATNAQRHAQARKLLARAAAHPAADDDLRARIAGTTAYVLAETGEPAKAEALCRDALERGGIRDRTRAVLAGQLGVLLTRSGRLDEAEEMLTVAVQGLDSVALANTLLNRSLLHMQRRDLDACTVDLERAVVLYREGGEAEAAAEAQHNLGYTALLRGDLIAALEAMASARPVIAAASELGAAVSDLDRAEVLRDAGLVDEAERLLAEVAARFGRARMRQARAEAEFHLARSLRNHDPARAARVAASALRRFRSLGSAGWAARAEAVRLDAALAAGAIPGPDEFAAASDALRAAGFPAESLAVRINAAAASDRRGDDPAPIPRVPAGAPTPLRLRAAEVRASRAEPARARRIAAEGLDLLTDWQRSFGALDLQASVAMHGTGLVFLGLRAAVDSADPATVFDWSERARQLSQRVAPVRPPHDQVLADDLTELRMLRADLTGGEWTTDPRVRALRDRVRERQWTTTGAGAVRPRARLDAVQAALGADTALLSYVFTEDRLVCLAATDRDAQVIPLSWPGAQQAMSGLRADLDVRGAVRTGPMATIVARALADRMARLDDLLLRPVLAALPDRERLVLTAPGALAGLPWSMLPGTAGRPITLATSASHWLDDRTARTGRPQRIGLVAGPRVPRAEEEVARAAQAWERADVLTRDAARVGAVVALADRSDVLHVAAHGHHAVDNPLFAGFELADGTLFGYDVDLIAHPPTTVVLSACELGRSAVRWGEEALGMTRVWLHAGARSVIAAPSAVPDDEAAELLSAVHAGLARGDDPSVALADASSRTGLCTPFQVHGSGL